ncbi:hypothetical protein BX616_002009 [Lobosporangium transversale]|uniref:F-box domain-containing protein n=1 Tax=Lobosporangium transversale TaxID=64571 RepID=A0A1Y2H2D2_9FUNG|nr:hypothetical protein BCR41DRAFT_383054 [Lobosporangium transversale]KAF9917071.1 hypothetical protein BX616_002009 [Lobosporangium transversale]ORZ28174.1 hypothetical protein BCR41DRAFT_383054 [Lobosporangium transversale]|eukprot:XP_021885859.1 hypothetical protein BCR41DRAFT_383054 [Lobosporangium transversale]
MTTPLNPLDIPEILARVGLYIPLWIFPDRTSTDCNDRSRFRPSFAPQTFFNCILVNRTWHDILLPFLWFTFDDMVFRGCTPLLATNILSRHGKHIRVLELSRPNPAVASIPLSLLPHNLLHLDLTGLDNSAWAKALVLQNTRLQSLHWQGGDFHRDDYGLFDASALSTKMNRLNDLHLECWKLDGSFMRLLRKNPSLRRIALDFVTGEIYPMSTASTSLEKLGPMEGQEPGTACAIEVNVTDTDDDDNEKDVKLLQLTSLTVCKDVESGALEALVRLCPALEELSWMGSHDGDLKQLTLNLQECCPSLTALTYSTVDIFQDEATYAKLIESIPRLVELQIRIPSLGDLFTKALLKHSSTLEILDLRILRHHALSHGSLKRILMGCPQITALSIDGAHLDTPDLFSFNWACLRLNRLFLLGLHAMTHGPLSALSEEDNIIVAEQHGWTAMEAVRRQSAAAALAGTSRQHSNHNQREEVNDQEGDGLVEDATLAMNVIGMGTTGIQQYGGGRIFPKVSADFLQKLLMHLQTLTHLNSFVLNGIEYTRLLSYPAPLPPALWYSDDTFCD